MGAAAPRGKKLPIEILSQRQIGGNEHLLVIEAGGRYFLLGVTSSSISLLTEFSKEEINAWEEQGIPVFEDKQNLFSAFIEKEMKKRQR